MKTYNVTYTIEVKGIKADNEREADAKAQDEILNNKGGNWDIESVEEADNLCKCGKSLGTEAEQEMEMCNDCR